MRLLTFWALWLLVGGIGARAWLLAACPTAACSFILVALQAPAFVLGAAAWLSGGVVASLVLLALPSRKPARELYRDGQAVQLGDRVRVVGGPAPVDGTVVGLPGNGLILAGCAAPEQATERSGFVVATDDGGVRHFLAADERVVLQHRQPAA